MRLSLKSLNENQKMMIKRRTGNILTSVFRYAFLIAIGYVIIVQLAYIISYSIRNQGEMYDPGVVWLTRAPTMYNFKMAFKGLDYASSFFRTVGIQVVSALIEVFTCAVAAYGFARFKFKGQGIMFFFVILTILLPPQMTAVSMYINYAHFDVIGILNLIGKIFGKEIRPNLLDTGFVFWLPSLFGTGLRSGLFIFIYRQFFKGLPKELEEAASIDGANAFMTFMRVVLPSSGVAMLTVTIFSIVWHWNDYYLSILYFTDNYPLSVELSKLSSNIYAITGVASATSTGILMAACALFMLPVLIMYIVLQRKFIASIDRVGIVG